MVRRLVNTLQWNKFGLILNPEDFPRDLALTHASFPTIASPLNSSEVIILFNVRDKLNESHIVSCNFDFEKMSLTHLNLESKLGPGKLGAFDDSGVSLGSVVNSDRETLLFYTGWNLTKKVIVNNSIGVAKFDQSKSVFSRLFDGPIMTRNAFEPYSCASPFVLWNSRTSKYYMWYASMDYWSGNLTNSKHFYDLKIAFSSDGINWERPANSVVSYASEDEYAFGRPFVRMIKNGYEMYFSVRGSSYQIERAISSDGINWVRLGPISLAGNSLGWDSNMQTYPVIATYKGIDYMFYNGNDYGKTGIGLAIRAK